MLEDRQTGTQTITLIKILRSPRQINNGTRALRARAERLVPRAISSDKFGLVVFEICERTGRDTDAQIGLSVGLFNNKPARSVYVCAQKQHNPHPTNPQDQPNHCRGPHSTKTDYYRKSCAKS